MPKDNDRPAQGHTSWRSICEYDYLRWHLLREAQQVGRVSAGKLPFGPAVTQSVVAEVYPALWSRAFASEGRNQHQHDAYAVALWMQQADIAGTLGKYFEPKLPPDIQKIVAIEGWILGLA